MHNFAVKRCVWGIMAAALGLTMLAPAVAVVPKGYGLSPQGDDLSVATKIPKGYGLSPEKGDLPAADPITKAIEDSRRQFQKELFSGFTKEERQLYYQLNGRIIENTKAAVKRRELL